MSKLKPCMNDMCGIHTDKFNYKCSFPESHLKQCKKYLTEKPESAHKKMWDELKWEIDWNIGDISVYNKMQEIEKELKE